MKRIFSVTLLLCGMAFGQLPFTPFQGYGAATTGGSNIVHVTNLNASGAGSLLACATVNGNHCVFDLGGTITQSVTLKVASNVTIDGFSAPSAVLITGGDPVNGGACIYIQSVSNVILQGVRFRLCDNEPAGARNTKSVEIVSANNVVVDHIESEEASDESLGVNNSHNVTISWGLFRNLTGESGCILHAFDSFNDTYHHNFFAGCTSGSSDSRVPLIGVGNSCCASGTVTDEGIQADVEWNVSGGYTPYGFIADDSGIVKNYGNLVGNWYGNTSDPDHAHNTISIMANNHSFWYLAGNGVAANLIPNQPPFTYYSASPFGSYALTSSNTLTCGSFTGCQPATPFATPTISGPCVFDAAARITEWNNVINTAGVIFKFADDTTAATARATIVRPTTALMNQAWNQQTGSCNTVQPPAAASHLFAVLR